MLPNIFIDVYRLSAYPEPSPRGEAYERERVRDVLTCLAGFRRAGDGPFEEAEAGVEAKRVFLALHKCFGFPPAHFVDVL
jgi:hypothetical protein